MQIYSSPNYAMSLKIVHWLIAVAVLCMLGFGFFLDDVPKQYQSTAFMLHKSTGITILFLTLFRFVLLRIMGRPALPPHVRFWKLYCRGQYNMVFISCSFSCL